MPTTIALGRDQTLSLDGDTLEGTREFDIDVDMETVNVTAWWHGWKSSLPVAGDVTIRLLIYWKDNYDKFAAKLNVHPPQPMQLAISNFASVPVVPSKVGIKGPINGVMAWDVTLRLWTYP